MDFDLKAARAAGYTDKEIEDYLRLINTQPRGTLAAPVARMSPRDAEAAFQRAKSAPYVFPKVVVDPFQEGAEQVARGWNQLWAPSGTTANDPRFWEQKAAGASDVIRGTTPFGMMAIPGALAAAPVATVAGLVGGIGAQHGTESLARQAGVPPGQTALLGDISGLVGGAMAGSLAHGITPEQIAATKQFAKTFWESELGEQFPSRPEVSTRIPTAVKATENPVEALLRTGYDSWRSQPEQLAKNAAALKTYPNFRDIRSTVPARIVETAISRMVENLLSLHDAMPEAVRGRSRLWYDGANKLAHDFSNAYNVAPEQAAGTLAVLSPQKDWFMNVDLARRILNGWRGRENLKWGPEMASTWDNKIGLSIADEAVRQGVWNRIQDRHFADMADPLDRAIWFRLHDEANYARTYPAVTPEGEFGDLVRTNSGEPGNVAWGDYGSIRKAFSILEDGSLENISRMLGNEHKVRSFYNNIIRPNSLNGHVTIDTHAVAAALLRALSGSSTEVAQHFGGKGSSSSSVTGESGMYGLYAEAYRRAAAQRRLLPREMQSITWEAIRGLFSPEFKRSPQLTQAVDNLWGDVARGRITRDEAINHVWRIANGIQEPAWVGTGPVR